MGSYADDHFKMGRRWARAWVRHAEIGEDRLIRTQPHELVRRREAEDAAAVGHPQLELLRCERCVEAEVVKSEVRVDGPRIAQKDMVLFGAVSTASVLATRRWVPEGWSQPLAGRRQG